LKTLHLLSLGEMDMNGMFAVGRIGIVATLCALAAPPALAKQAAKPEANRIEIAYVEPSDPAHRQTYDLLKERRVLERFQAYLSPLKLPRKLSLKTAGCEGESNAWYDDTEHTVTVCYEYLDEVLRNAPQETTPSGITRQDAIVGPTVEVFLHEVGHAVFDLLKVPIFGREEDAADQLADYLLLHLDKDIARQTIKGVAYMYGHEMQSQTPGLQQFANVHGLSAQRFFNTLCMAYGYDAKLFGDLVEEGYLPESRAEDCAGEYRQVDYAFKRLIYPYIDQRVRANVQPKKQLRPQVEN
jgi:hypothetical protein